MSEFARVSLFIIRVLASFALLGGALATTPIVHMPPREGIASNALPQPKSYSPSEFLALPLSVTIGLPEPTDAELLAKGRLSAELDPTISFGRNPKAYGISGIINAATGVTEVRATVTSSGAAHLRSAWSFGDNADYEIIVFADGNPGRPLVNRRNNLALTESTWSAVTDGATQEVVIRRLGPATAPWNASLAMVSHFDHSFVPTNSPIRPKSFGDSASCQSDIACVLDVTAVSEHAAILNMSRSVAYIVLTNADGTSETCTGTMLSTANYPAPYFLTAYHCTRNAVALDAYWFYSRTNCGYGTISPFVQTTGGAARVWESAALDSSLLLLNQIPPAPASYAGWDANTVNATTTIIAVHHPRGDVKKASLGDIIGVNSFPIFFSGLGTFPTGTFHLVDWDVGIVEPGSSGSSAFSYDVATDGFYTRGTLTGGNATCSGIKSRTYYSRFDNIFPYIEGPLTVPTTPPVGTQTVIEYHHASFDHYFITPVAAEIALLDAHAPPFQDWSRTGFSFNVYIASTAPPSSVSICRFFNTSFAPKSSHFYAAKGFGCEDTISLFPDWGLEDDKLFNTMLPNASGACPTGTIPVYRLYNNGMGGAPNHRFVTSLSERQNMLNKGYTPEGNGIGVGMCVPP